MMNGMKVGSRIASSATAASLAGVAAGLSLGLEPTTAIGQGTSSCEDLAALALARTTVTAELTPEGAFSGGGRAGFGGRGGGNPEPLPAHCRVRMVLEPSDDSSINSELWLPVENWNGKLLVVGNGHPEKIVDFAYRAIHETTDKSKQIVDVFYPAALEHSYFKGCSTGGRQAAMAAQRYPLDFDGIIGGAMANRMIYMHTAAVVREMRVTVNPDQRIPEATADFVSDAVMRACDVLGEGFLNNPRQCEFDFSTLACGAGQSGGQCLSPGQLETVETFYGGVRNSAGESIFAGQAPGNPLPAMTGFDPAGNPAYGFDTIRYWGFQDEDYDWRNFDLDRDMPGIIENVGYVNSIDPDLREFKRNGGKLLLYAGWGDTAISPENTAYYYETVLDEMGRDQFVRDEAPDRLVGTNRQSGLTRPVCPYPQYARYDGTGAPGEASSWSCAAP